MNIRAATLDPGGLVESPAEATARITPVPPEGVAHADEVLRTAVAPAPEGRAPREAKLKFQYASGSRPLDGFTIKRGIGRGGFGEVYFATSDAGKEVALKHVERNLEVELRGVGQCLNLKHPNLIDLFDVRYDDLGDAWVVMEYVAGASLKDVIDRNPNGLPIDQVNHWFRGIAAGTAYLHDHGIVHRDLKPGNVFDDADTVKIGDYGLSKFISASRKSAQTESVGTFHYMAPEIGKGVYGKEIDIYALGIVLYEMLTGRVPFDGESSQEIIMKHLTADPDLSGIAQPYRTIIQRALQKDPEKRYRNVGEMLATLEGLSHAVKQLAAQPAAAVAASAKPGLGVPPAQLLPPPRLPVEPLYIGAEDDGIELGDLHIDAKKIIVPAQVVGARVPAARPAIARPATALPAAEEPIARAVATGWRKFVHWWNHGPMTTPIKLALLATVGVVAIVHGGWLLPVAIVFGSVYLVYLGIRLLTTAISSPPPNAAEGAVNRAVTIRSSGWHPLLWEQQGRALLNQKTAGDRIGELTGSMLAAAFIAGVLAVVMTAIGGESIDNSANPYAGPAWLWLATTLGSWLVLGSGKFFERTSGEQVKRRFAMLTLGLAFGAVLFLASQFLMVALQDGAAARSIAGNAISAAMFDSAGTPRIAAFLAYFGAVFLAVGWWKQTDPLRSSRLRIGPILTTLVAAWAWWFLCPFPQPWGFMIVTAISITSQLAAPWLSPAERTTGLARTH